MSFDANPEDTESVSRDTRDKASIENIQDFGRDAADQFSRDAVHSNTPSLAEPLDYSTASFVGPTVTDPPVDSLKRRRVHSTERTKSTPPSDTSSRAAKAYSRQLPTFLPGPHNDSQSRVNSRSQTRTLLETSPEGGSSGQTSAEVERDFGVLDSNSIWLSVFQAYEALQASKDSLVEKDDDSVRADPSRNTDERKSPYKIAWLRATKEELEGSIFNDPSTLIDKLPKGRRAITERRVFRRKLSEYSKVVLPKLCTVIRAVHPRTRSGLLRHVYSHSSASPIRLLSGVALERSITLSHFDIQQNFLKVSLKDGVYRLDMVT